MEALRNMRQRVYIETTIPSFYYEVRQAPEMIARREWTRAWWDSHSREYELVTSIPVVEELEAGEQPQRQDALSLLSNVSMLPIEDSIGDIVDTYIEHLVMPRDPRGDAIHLALASYHHCHFLLTWNCAHLANANKFEHIRHVNAILGLFTPVLTTPLEMLSDEEE